MIYLSYPGEEAVLADYSDIVVAWSLNKIFTWSNAVLKIRRSSDNATAFVFFDGASASNVITTSSYISTSSDTTPSTTTLGTWVGSNDAFVEIWYGMTYNDVINTNRKPSQTTTSAQPKFITAGVINTENGKPTISFDGGDYLRQNGTNIISELQSSPNNPWTIFTISRNTVASSFAAVYCNHFGNNFGIKIANDTRTTGGIYRATLIATSAATYTADLNSGQGATQRLLTSLKDDGTNQFWSYYNGAIQGTDTYTLSHGNDDIIIGAHNNATSKITGNIQEILIFGTEFSTARLAAHHTDRNDYYSIY